MATEGLEGIATYAVEELALVPDFLRRGRQLHERHLARVRGLPRTRRAASS